MKLYPSKSAQLFYLTGVMQVIFLFSIWPLTTACFGSSNNVPWSDNFENYANLTPLINGTNGWYASDTNCIVQQDVKYTGSQAAKISIDATLSNRFVSTNERIVRMEMYVQPQLYNGSNYPDISSTNNNMGLSTNVAVQFFINSNGYFVVANGTNWRTATTMTDGTAAIPITNAYFTKIQLNLRYKNHTWNLKAWTNSASVTTLVAHTHYFNFTSNLNAFNGFDIYNGNSTSYVDDVSVTNIDYNLLPKINTVPVDIIRSINGVQPPVPINGVIDD